MRRLSVFVLLFAVACAPATQNIAPGAADGFTGSYTATLDAADLPSTTTQQQRSTLSGTWTFAFQPGNHFVWRRNGSEVARGPYQIEGNQITFPGDQTGRISCSATGVYTWEITDGQLTFTPVREGCHERIAVLTSRPLARRR